MWCLLILMMEIIHLCIDQMKTLSPLGKVSQSQKRQSNTYLTYLYATNNCFQDVSIASY